jgi:V-type H+-transporting ATPase subunit a
LNADVSAFQRKFVPELRRCDEMERKLRYLDEELQKAEIPVIDNNESPEAPLPKETLPLENDLEQLEKQMREVSQNQEQLNKNFLELTELKHVLRKTQVKLSCFCSIC